MKCKKCGYEIPDGVKFCPLCGERQSVSVQAAPVMPPPPPQPMYGYVPRYEGVKDSPKYVGFGEAIILYFKNYVNFSTRSTRSEYWYAYLFTSIVRTCCSLVDLFLPVKIFSFLAAGTFLLPSLSIAYRRFHDTGRTGTIPLVKTIANFVWGIIAAVSLVLTVLYIFGAARSSSDEMGALLLFVAAFVLGIIPLGLDIYQIVICCLPGENKPNNYGREPRY